MDMNTLMFGHPFEDLFVLVRSVVIADQVQRFSLVRFAIDLT